MATDEDEDNCKMYFMAIFLWGCVATMIYLIWYGADTMNSADNYSKSSTEEDCYLIDYESENCKYGKKRYTYTAYVFDKCGNETVLTSEYSNKCEKDAYELNQYKTCYVLDCNKERFTFTKAKDVGSTGLILLVLGIIFGIVSLGLAVAVTIVILNNQKEPSDPDIDIYRY